MATELVGESRSYVEHVNNVGALDMSQPIQALRELSERTAQMYKGDFEFVGTAEEKLVPVKVDSASHQVPVTVLRPERESGDKLNKVLVYFHGGGWVWSSRNTHMKFCEMIASRCNCVVVNVEYRLSPEHKFPACYDDAVAVVNWCQDNKKLLTNCDSPLVGVGGDSAGGNIAASVCHLVKGLAFQVLIYPSLTLTKRNHYPSYFKYGEGLLLTKEMMAWFVSHFLTNPDETEDSRCSPMNNTEFAGLPPALFIVSECDPLADQSPEYEKKLQGAQINTKRVTLKGTVHGFVSKPGYFKDTTARTVGCIADFLSSYNE
ncbi:ethyl acetate hydrolase-like [Watersipora subatra]|uniref:ethyl acetate hydrolase-like n=1 Tax=Watersipora subatra TaxID=2589382 RepID=UPI00355C2492